LQGLFSRVVDFMSWRTVGRSYWSEARLGQGVVCCKSEA